MYPVNLGRDNTYVSQNLLDTERPKIQGGVQTAHSLIYTHCVEHMDSEHHKEVLEKRLAWVNTVLENESPDIRPPDANQKPGGLVVLHQGIPTIIVPDLHGRHDYLSDLIRFTYKRKQIYDWLKEERIQIVCVGDGMHGERRAASRWRLAFEEYKEGFKECPAMAEEMRENFQTMAMVMKLKSTFPAHFHFLKGNHENILDESVNGNHPFAKFAAEGPMTKFYVEMFFGPEFLSQYDRFEKNLPLLARGTFFLISHARPKKIYAVDEIINYRSRPDLIEGLTWTRHQAAEIGAVSKTLDTLIGDCPEKKAWFVGHTAIKKLYKQWEEEPLIEIHNPDKRIMVIVDPTESFAPDRHITVLPSTKTSR